MKIGKFEIKNFGEPFIIAEIGSNHNGDIELAKKLIDKAKECGCHSTKFQHFDTRLFSRMCYESSPEKRAKLAKDPILNKLFTKIHPELEKEMKENMIDFDQVKEIKKYCDKKGIIYSCTPLSFESVDFHSDELDVEFIKVASMDLNNYPFLEYIAKKCKPIVLSTGMSTYEEVEKGVKTIVDAGNDKIILLHCVSIYPPRDEIVNLNNIDTLSEMFKCPVGFSDHTFGYSIPLAAVAKGACMIEKHFTLDKNMPGWDHKISADPEEMRIIVEESKRIYKALGSKNRVISQDELDKRKIFRRSIVAAKDLKAGQILVRKDIDFKRPGIGIEPGRINEVIGKRLKRNLDEDDLVMEEYIK